MLPASVRADLNRTITKSMLGADVLSDLNQSIKTITRDMLPASVRADLNRTVTSSNIAANTITTAQLNEQILKYLKPEITSPPQSPGLVYEGQSVSLEGQAEGKFLNYQWFHNGEIIPSATDRKLTVTDLNSSLHDGIYSLVISNDFGSISAPGINLDINTTRNYYRVLSADNMEMIWVENDKFIMGQLGVYAPEHNVTITDGYFLGKTEVTQKQYSSVMVGNTSGLSSHPSAFVGENLPVESVTWPQIKVFLQRLNQLEGDAGRLKPGWQYVLPTEAEWELACRAGTRTTFSWGNQIDAENANWNHGDDQNKTLPVMNYPENPWGFFDMHGNVWELTSDWWGGFTSSDKVDPEGAIKGVNRVNKGGSWNDAQNYLRSSSRLNFTPSINSSIARQFGFRVALKKIKQDTKPPQIFLSQSTNITVEAGVNFSDPGYQAHDIRDGEISSQVTVTGSVDVNTTGTYILNYSVADAAGNQDTATRTVTVKDNTAPVLSLLGYAVSTQAKDTPWVDLGATAHDSFDGNLTSSINITGVVDVNTTGVYTLTYSVSDVANNEANITRSVHVMPSTHNADLNSSIQLQMLWVEPGTFTMGSPTTEANRQSDRENQHNVKISKGFYLGQYEITQAQYEAVMTGNTDGLNAKPSNWPNNPNRPVEMVSWTDIQTFLTRLNSAEQASGNLPSGWSYVLPTESQWEYACRAGTSTAYFWGNDINSSRANYNWSGSYIDGNDSKQTVDVGQFAPNSWGFFDMHGNVWEWTHDWYQPVYPTGNPVVDPTGPLSGTARILGEDLGDLVGISFGLLFAFLIHQIARISPLVSV